MNFRPPSISFFRTKQEEGKPSSPLLLSFEIHVSLPYPSFSETLILGLAFIKEKVKLILYYPPHENLPLSKKQRKNSNSYSSSLFKHLPCRHFQQGLQVYSLGVHMTQDQSVLRLHLVSTTVSVAPICVDWGKDSHRR